MTLCRWMALGTALGIVIGLGVPYLILVYGGDTILNGF